MKRLSIVAPLIVAMQFAGGCSRQAKTSSSAGAGESPAATVPQAPSTPAQPAPPKTSEKYVSVGGITIPMSAQDAPQADFSRENSEGQVTDYLSGPNFTAHLKYGGLAAFSQDGRLAKGTRKFNPTQLMTSRDEGVWVPISKRSLDEHGFLIVTDANGGEYRIMFGWTDIFAPKFDGKIEELKAPNLPPAK